MGLGILIANWNAHFGVSKIILNIRGMNFIELAKLLVKDMAMTIYFPLTMMDA